MIKAVVFDLGGVLFKRVVPKTMIKVSKDYNLDNDAVKAFFDRHFTKVMRGEADEDEFYFKVIKKFNLPLKKDFFYHNFYVKALPIKGTWDLASKLKRSYKLGIISDITHNWARYKEKVVPLKKTFDIRIYSCDHGTTKPARKIFRIFLKKAKLQAEECIFIDDKPENTGTAKKMGFKTILFKNPVQLRKDLSRHIDIK